MSPDDVKTSSQYVPVIYIPVYPKILPVNGYSIAPVIYIGPIKGSKYKFCPLIKPLKEILSYNLVSFNLIFQALDIGRSDTWILKFVVEHTRLLGMLGWFGFVARKRHSLAHFYCLHYV